MLHRRKNTVPTRCRSLKETRPPTLSMQASSSWPPTAVEPNENAENVHASLLRTNATPGWVAAFCSVGAIVRAHIAEAFIARQNIASAVAIFERVILTVPIGTPWAQLDHRAPGGLVSLGRLQPEKRSGKTSDGNQIHAGHRQPPCSPTPPIFTSTQPEINCPLGHHAGAGNTADVRLGPQADICGANRHIPLAPESGHAQRTHLTCAPSIGAISSPRTSRV